MAAMNKDFFREGQPSQLLLFDLPTTQTAVENIYYQDILPISQITGDSPVEFVLSGQSGTEYIDLKNSTIFVKAKIKKTDGTEIADDEDVGPINLFLPALFQQVDVTLQGKTVVSTNNHYPYKAYIQTLLKYGKEAKDSQLQAQLWVKDTDEHMDAAHTQEGNNHGLLHRTNRFQGGQTCDMEGPLFHDLFKMNRYILNGVNIGVKLYRTKPEFCLMSNADSPSYHVVFEEIVLKVAKVKVNPAVVLAQTQTLNETNAKYPFTQTIVKQITIPSGGTSFTYDNIFQGVRPNFLCVGFVKAIAATGAYKENPWYFKHFNVTELGLYVDGISVNGNPLKLNYTSTKNKTFVNVFNNMYRATNKWMDDKGLDISLDNISKGYALYTFNLEPLFDDEEYLTLLKQGNVRLEVTFGTALAETISCIIYAEYPGYFEINASRDIVLSP